MAGTKKKQLQAKPDFSPVKKRKKSFGNYLDVIDTQVPHFSIVIATRGDKNECPYMKPIVDAFEEDMGGELSAKWSVIKIAPQKGEKNASGEHEPVPNSPDHKIAWDVIVAYKKSGNASSKTLGTKLAKELNEFVKDSPEVSV